ncbi:hypothetical protein CYMTET_45754 [Cymbomonas tetramitiformis]|uniref:Uncharacterized protein n=1 Tax=Cymbomonas tetramitiformis TaxID=36881 RepID=A0AAE0BYY9_9CHLO|nr:hypothetical protein CYMTET_45754 [Cymbomonas tetramitiformis]
MAAPSAASPPVPSGPVLRPQTARALRRPVSSGPPEAGATSRNHNSQHSARLRSSQGNGFPGGQPTSTLPPFPSSLSAGLQVSDVSKLHECVTALAQAAETLSAAAAAAPKLSVSERVSNWLQDSNVDEAMQAQLSMRSKSPGMDGPPRELRASGTSSAQGGPKAEEQAQVKTAGDAIGRELDTFTNRPHSSRAENSRAETPRMAASSQAKSRSQTGALFWTRKDSPVRQMFGKLFGARATTAR